MGQIKELSELSAELHKCGETLIKICECINGLISPEPVSFEELRAALASKSEMGYTDDIKEILYKHGAEKLSDVRPEEYRTLLEEVEKLERNEENA